MTVTAEYQVRPPMAPTHFFLIDVSQVRCGAWGEGGFELGALRPCPAVQAWAASCRLG